MATSFSWTVNVAAASSTASVASPAGSDSIADAMRDWALDPATGDLLLGDGGDMAVVTGIEAIASDLQSRLQTVLGEWELDATIGLDFFGEIADRPTNDRLVELFRAQILGCPGVLTVDTLTVDVDTSRTAFVGFAATTDFGELVVDLQQQQREEG